MDSGAFEGGFVAGTSVMEQLINGGSAPVVAGASASAAANMANALRETGPAHVDANLYLVVMEMPSFSEEALIVAYTILLDNKAQGRGFVNMSDAHRALWLRTFLAKNYYV